MKTCFLGAIIAASVCTVLSAAPPGTEKESRKSSIERTDGGINFAALNERLLAVISDKRSTEEDLRRAIDHLGRPVESPKFWTAIANDDAYKTEHRRKCIFAFFRRHTMAESSLTSLASILDNPTWLHFDRIQRIDVLTGWIPVEATINDTVFRVPVLSDRYSIYFRLFGQTIPTEKFTRLLKGELTNAADDLVILGCGLYDEKEMIEGKEPKQLPGAEHSNP